MKKIVYNSMRNKKLVAQCLYSCRFGRRVDTTQLSGLDILRRLDPTRSGANHLSLISRAWDKIVFSGMTVMPANEEQRRTLFLVQCKVGAIFPLINWDNPFVEKDSRVIS